MLQVLILSGIAGGAGYAVLWYLYLAVIWFFRLSANGPMAQSILRIDITPYQWPAALGCALLAASFIAGRSSAEVDALEAKLERRELDDKIAAIETKQPQTY
jgi:hypothetical protein